MPASASIQQLSDDIVLLAGEIIGMTQRLKHRGATEFVGGTPRQRAAIVDALALTPAQVDDLVAAEQHADASAAMGGTARRVQIWDYDTKTATTEDLARRRDLLRNYLRVLEYLRVH